MQFNLLNFLILNYWKYMNILIVYYSINIMFPSKLVSQNHHPNMFVKVVWKKNTSATTDPNINRFSQTNFYPNQLLKNHIEKKTFLHHFSQTHPK